MRLLVLHDARGGGGGAGDFFLLRPDAHTRRHRSSAARDGEPRSVNATRRDRNDMLLCRDDQ